MVKARICEWVKAVVNKNLFPLLYPSIRARYSSRFLIETYYRKKKKRKNRKTDGFYRQISLAAFEEIISQTLFSNVLRKTLRSFIGA